MIRSVRLPVLRILVLSLLTHWCVTANAVGLGSIRVQSSLGQRLAAEIPIIGSDSAELTSTCIKARLQSSDGAAIGNAIVAMSHTSRGDAILLSTRQVVNEPAVLVEVNIVCGPAVHRDFSILLDPVGLMPVIPDVAARPLSETTAALRLPESSQPPRRRNRAANASSSANDADGNNGISTDDAVVNRNANSEPRSRRFAPPEITTASPPISSASTSSKRVAIKLAAPSKNVLKLSSEGFTDAELASMGHLKMSSTMADTALPVDAAQRAGLLAARNLFAQLMRGEDLAQVVQAEQSASLQQVKTLQNQVATISRQRAVDRAALEDLKKNSLPLNWVFVLIGLLLLSVIGACLLAWRLLIAKRQTATAWDVALANQEAQQGRGGHGAGGLAGDGNRTNAALATMAAAASPSTMAANPPVNLASNNVPKSQRVSTDFGHNSSVVQTAANHHTGVAGVTAPSGKSVRPNATMPDRADLAFTLPVAAASAGKPSISIDQQDAMHFYSSKVEHLKVEEISDVMQEAEFWMSLNDPHRAMEILEPYAAVDLPDSPMPWLYLLDLYRGIDEQLKYTLLQEKAARIFNVRIALWDEDADLMDGRTLEDFPHVVDQICTLWETNDIFAYLEDLIFDRREGIRTGFDLSVYQEIMLLLTMVRSYGRERPANPLQAAENNRMAIE